MTGRAEMPALAGKGKQVFKAAVLNYVDIQIPATLYS
jgi:hypothetical protein